MTAPTKPKPTTTTISRSRAVFGGELFQPFEFRGIILARRQQEFLSGGTDGNELLVHKLAA
jgi:hypothetical protein